MVAVYLDIGSNIERRKNIQSCVNQLLSDYPDIVFSKAYESESLGFDGEPFINVSACLETESSYPDFKRYLKDIEDQHARVREKTKYISRTLDVDVLLYGDAILHPEFDVPRAEILKFPFVLFPLAEIAADVVHPEERITIAELAKRSKLDKNTLTEVIDFPRLPKIGTNET